MKIQEKVNILKGKSAEQKDQQEQEQQRNKPVLLEVTRANMDRLEQEKRSDLNIIQRNNQ